MTSARVLELCETARRRDAEAVGVISKTLETVVDSLESVSDAIDHYKLHMRASERQYAALRRTLASRKKRRRPESQRPLECDSHETDSSAEMTEDAEASAAVPKRPRKRAKAHKMHREQDRQKMRS